MRFRGLLRARANPAAPAEPVSDFYSLASDETSRGGYLITEDPEAPVMVLTAPLPLNSRAGDARHMSVSVPPEMLQAGQFYLIGTHEEQSCEVVRVEGEPVPGEPRLIRRHLFRTLGARRHPAGTWVRRVTVQRVFDWSRWESQQEEE